jgi:hypothetical protein
MKRRAVLKIIRREAKRQGVGFLEYERTNHTGIRVGDVETVIARHIEIHDIAVIKLFKQIEPALGKDWWHKWPESDIE